MNSNMYDADLYVQAHTQTCTHTHTHTHWHTHVYTHTHTQWLKQKLGTNICWGGNTVRRERFQFGFKTNKRGQSWAVSKVLWEWIANVGSKAKVESAKAMRHMFVSVELFFSEGGRRKMCVVYKTECRHIAVQRSKQAQHRLYFFYYYNTRQSSVLNCVSVWESGWTSWAPCP